eukprot:12919922-Prorocentrum_lima.AAC.1
MARTFRAETLKNTKHRPQKILKVARKNGPSTDGRTCSTQRPTRDQTDLADSFSHWMYHHGC